MRVSPYIQFNGNCAEAVALYEKVFGVKAEISRYADAPTSEGYQPPQGTENFIMHAQFKLGNDTIMFCDMPPDAPVAGNNIAISVSFDDIDNVKTVFEALKEGGKVSMEPQGTFWSKCFASLEDKYGVSWMLGVEYCTEQK